MPAADTLRRRWTWTLDQQLSMVLLSLLLITVFSIRPASGQYSRYVWGQDRFSGCESPLTWFPDPCDFCGDGGACSQDGCNVDCNAGLVARRPPAWYGSVDYIPMMGDPTSDVILARQGSATGPVVFNTGTPDGAFNPGGRFVLGRTFADCYQLEMAYQGHYSGDDRAQLVDPTADLAYVFSGFSAADNGTQIEARTGWQMSTAEFNWRKWIDVRPGQLDLQLIFGGRFFTTSDGLYVRSVGAVTTERYVTADNDMFGPQLGFNSKWLTTRASYIEFELKGALCSNFTTVTHSGAGGVTLTDQETLTSFVSDFMLTFNMMIAPNVSVRAGYQAIIANGLALSPQNMATTAAPPTALIVNGDGDKVYHGPVLGLVSMW